jgi:hypothetical protein
MRSATFGGIGLTSQHFDFNGLTAPYSLTEQYVITAMGATAPAIILRSVSVVPWVLLCLSLQPGR